MFWLVLLLPSVIGASLCGECLNEGECLQNRTDPSQFYCRCPIGFFGERCEELDYCKNSGFTSPGINPCANGGECKNVTGGFECKCMDVFKGHRCEEDVDECENKNVCLNDGVCENRHGSFRCICPNGLAGKHCEINIDDCAENPCQNGAKCIDGVDTFTCECPKGYIGQTCDRLDECFHNNPCVNGNCSLNSKGLPRCECGNEFTGDHCETDVDECVWNPCGGRGQCQNTIGSFQCHCFAGYEGARCDRDIDYCKVARCVNGGSCISQKHGYVCSCVVGFSGRNCEHRDDENCKLPCENGGRCHNETHCECPNSFKGQYCEIEKPDPCGGDPCVNGGVCLNNRDYNDFVCRCPKGFSGKFCEFKNCNGDQECEMMPYHCIGEQCLNGGTCINLQTGFKCHCHDGFLGHRCELQNSTSVRVTAGSGDSDKKGPVLVYLVGDSELVRRHVNEILHTMETSLQVEVKLAKDGDKKPMIYEWDSANGPGQRIDVDLKADGYSEKEVEQDNVVRGVFMMLNVDTTHCKASETECPKNLVEAAKALMSPTTQRALQPLGIHVKDAEGPQKPESTQKGFWFMVLLAAGLCSLLIISAVNVLTNLNKNKKDPFTGMIKKGSLIYHANSKRNSKSFSASTFIPPMEKPLIPTVQAYDYLQNPSYMQFGAFGHQNYGMIPSNSQSNRVEKPRIIAADETKLLPERASAADDIHHWAIERGIIHSLPEGVQINRPDHVCRTALHWVVEIKEESESLIDVDFLYHKGADLNAFDMGGDTPLMLAVKTWRNELVAKLLALGASPTLVNTQGDTALHMAVQTGNELAVSHLLKCPDIDIELGNEVEDTPLKLSAKVGGPFFGIASKLIDAGAQVDATGDGTRVNGLKRTALHEASLSGAEKIMELLLKNGAQVDAKDSNLQTPLHLAARNKRLESLKLLLKWNANKSFEDIDGYTPLNLAEQQLFDIGVRELIGTGVSSPESLDGVSTTQSDKKLNGTMKKPQTKRKTAHQADSPPPKLVHVPSSMLSPSSERCTPPQQSSIFHQQPTSSHHKPLNLCPQDLGQSYCDYNQRLFYSYPSTNSSNYSSQSDSPDNSTQHPGLQFDPFIPKKSTQIGHFMI